MNTLPDLASNSLQLVSQPSRLRLIETAGRQSEGITELFAALAMRGSFYAIAGGEWIPTYALVQSIRRRTPEVQQVLGRVRLARPFTCYQVLDLLEEIRPERDPILILDFLHHFYNPDIQPVRPPARAGTMLQAFAAPGAFETVARIRAANAARRNTGNSFRWSRPRPTTSCKRTRCPKPKIRSFRFSNHG